MNYDLKRVLKVEIIFFLAKFYDGKESAMNTPLVAIFGAWILRAVEARVRWTSLVKFGRTSFLLDVRYKIINFQLSKYKLSISINTD